MPDTPEELEVDGRSLPRTGNLIIGTIFGGVTSIFG